MSDPSSMRVLLSPSSSLSFLTTINDDYFALLTSTGELKVYSAQYGTLQCTSGYSQDAPVHSQDMQWVQDLLCAFLYLCIVVFLSWLLVCEWFKRSYWLSSYYCWPSHSCNGHWKKRETKTH